MLGQVSVVISLFASAHALFDRNLAYRTPFNGYEEVGSCHSVSKSARTSLKAAYSSLSIPVPSEDDM